MIFASGTPYELWWTGKEFKVIKSLGTINIFTIFKAMRLEACEQMLGEGSAQIAGQHFDLAIGHFHDLLVFSLGCFQNLH